MAPNDENPAFFAIARVLGGHNVESLEKSMAAPYNKYIICAFPNNKLFGRFKDKQDLVEKMQENGAVSVSCAIYEIDYTHVLEIYNKAKNDKTKHLTPVYFDARDVGEIPLLPKSEPPKHSD